MTIYKADFTKAEQAAQNVLQINNINSLPIKVKKIAKRFPNLKIRTYSWFSNKYKMSHEEVCEIADSQEGCCWYFKTFDKYLILYNEKIPNKGRIRWTLAHELGHYILKHNEITNKAKLSRSSLTDEEYLEFEREANCFARELLAPPPVIRKINISNKHFISNLCNISWEAANNVHKFLTTGTQLGINYTSENPIVKQFSNFIYDVKYALFCKNCQHRFSNKSAEFCPVCGKNNLVKNSLFNRGRNKKLIYLAHDLDDEMRVKQCPRCENEEVSGNYCKVCGTYLFNVCTGIEPNTNYDNRYTRWDQVKQGCDELLDGNARFCPSCGATSSFFEEGLLTRWDAVTTENNQLVSTDGTAIDISDDELPF